MHSSDVGYAIAIALAQLGAQVTIVDKIVKTDNKEIAGPLESLEKEGKLNVVIADTGKWTDIDAKLSEVVDKIDLLVNCSAPHKDTKIGEIDESLVQAMINTNAVLAIHLTQLVSKGMIERKKGSIVNISSSASLSAFEGYLGYSCSVAAMDQVSKVAGVELAKYNVRVNSVNPGYVCDPKAQEWFLKLDLDDIVNPVIFLLSDAAPAITANVIAVDNGWSSLC